MARTPDEIWAADLLCRRGEAEVLIPFLETASSRSELHGHSGAYTLAVDASYGFGKSFFLVRLAEQLGIDHPVAFVDAWADDLADEPFTALVATLKRAIEPQIAAVPEVGIRFATVLQASGKVAKIVGKGLLRRAAALAISAVAVDELEQLGAGLSDAAKEAIGDQLKEAGDNALELGDQALTTLEGDDLMRKRVEAFEAGRASIRELKSSLRLLVQALKTGGLYPPIFIVIDELDRCRPTYAVKLLEEVKHLFDVAGLVFIFGLHGDQLAHSVAGAYGSGFDGAAYLRRFFQRTYHLQLPPLAALLAVLRDRIDPIGKDVRHAIPSPLDFPIAIERGRRLSWEEIAASYLKAFDVSARDAFRVMDMLETCLAVAPDKRFIMPLLIPTVIAAVKADDPELMVSRYAGGELWRFLSNNVDESGKNKSISLKELYGELRALRSEDSRTLVGKLNAGGQWATGAALIVDLDGIHRSDLAHPANYERLVQTVARLSGALAMKA